MSWNQGGNFLSPPREVWRGWRGRSEKADSFGRAPSLDHSGGNPLNYSLSESKNFPLVPFLSSNSHAYPLKDTRVHRAGFFLNARDWREIPGLSFDSAHR